MADLGLFLIPVVSGYWFLTHLYLTRYSALRDSGYHVLFRAVIAGIMLALMAHFLVIFVLNPCFPKLSEFWSVFIPISYPGTAMLTTTMLTTAMLTFLLAFVLPCIGNQLYDKEKAARRAALDNGDLIELLIAESIEDQRLIELSLRSGKSYIGFALESGITRQGETDIALIPIASGYRNKDTQELEITTNYAAAVKESLEKMLNLELNDFRIVLPMTEIISARVFHLEAYRRFRRENAQ